MFKHNRVITRNINDITFAQIELSAAITQHPKLSNEEKRWITRAMDTTFTAARASVRAGHPLSSVLLRPATVEDCPRPQEVCACDVSSSAECLTTPAVKTAGHSISGAGMVNHAVSI